MTEPLPAGITQDMLHQFMDDFLNTPDTLLSERDRMSNLECRDFTECLRDACTGNQSVSHADLQQAYTLWLNIQGTLNTPLLRSHHSLTFTKHMAKKLAPFFCKEPPSPPPLPSAVTVPKPSGACSPARALARDDHSGWWGVLGATVFLIDMRP